MKVEELAEEVRRLSPAELNRFAEWFVQFDSEVWDQQFEADAAAGKFDAAAERAIQSHAAGQSTEL
ncbi:MAG: uncharacterized protein HW416_1687 [Chloroflexi bacterium]|nr:uncharacterized protein [Chloroflexota bacterium]